MTFKLRASQQVRQVGPYGDVVSDKYSVLLLVLH